MAKRYSRKILRLSCAWIKEHWDATNLDVPPELLRHWIYQPEREEDEPEGFYLGVFLFGYMQYELNSNSTPMGVKRTLPVDDVPRLFQFWQMKLALAEIHQQTEVRIKAMPLFQLCGDETISYHYETRPPVT